MIHNFMYWDLISPACAAAADRVAADLRSALATASSNYCKRTLPLSVPGDPDLATDRSFERHTEHRKKIKSTARKAHLERALTATAGTGALRHRGFTAVIASLGDSRIGSHRRTRRSNQCARTFLRHICEQEK
jgi:hypothetical protein